MKKTNTKLLAVLMTLALLISAVCFMTAATEPTTAALGYSASRVVKKDTTGIPDIKDYANNNTAKLSEYSIAEAMSALNAAGINPASYGELTISVKVRSAPHSRQTIRIALSVKPDIGARQTFISFWFTFTLTGLPPYI